MSLPAPRPGLVIGYSYLWAAEHRRGAEEGIQNRPCAIVIAQKIVAGREIVTVIPITPTPPGDPGDGVEIPAAIKRRLGLDDLPSWVVVTETNDFLWPGSDLSPAPGASPRRFFCGMPPPRFYAHVRDRLLRAHSERRLQRIRGQIEGRTTRRFLIRRLR